MIPKSLSASSLKNWMDCPAMFVASNIRRVPEVRANGSNRAKVGTAAHYALEHFVDDVYLKKVADWSDLELLVRYVHDGFKDAFGHADFSSEDFKDALNLVKNWHARTDLSKWTVLQVEQKKQYQIADTGVPFTYIFDRISYRITDDGIKILKVTDYKSIVDLPNFSDLETHMQLRFYGLMAAIEYKDWAPDEIHVELDLLRHDTTRGIEIKRSENIETWNFLLETTRMILETDEDKAEYRLGPGCRYCPIAASCPELKTHADAGGALGWSLDKVLQRYHEITGQMKGLDALSRQLGDIIAAEAKNSEDGRAHGAGGWLGTFGKRSRRELRDTITAAEIIGPDLMKTIGTINIGDIDKLLDSELITEDQKNQLRSLIVRNPIKNSLKVTPPNPMKKAKQ